MEQATITAFLAIGAVIFIGFFGSLVFNRLRIPDVLILVFVGMVLGPDLLGGRFGLVTDMRLEDINQYRDFFLSAALVIILFDGGLCLDIRSVIESMRLSAFVTVLTFVLEVLAVAAVVHLALGMDILLAFTLGAIVGGTSGAIVIPIANRLRIRPKTKAIMIMESAVTDVLVVVTALTFLEVARIGEFDAITVAEELAIKFLASGLIGFVAGIAWLFVLEKLHNQPLSYMITMAALFLIAGIVEMLQSSGAVAALFFGLSIGNKRFVRRRLTSISLRITTDTHIQQFHSEISFFVRTFFFVYLGLIFSFETFTQTHLIIGLALVSVIALVRRATTLLTERGGYLDKDEADALFGMMPRGLAAAVLATLPASMLADRTDIWKADYAELFLNVTLIVILGTTMLATIFSFRIEKRIDRRNRMELRRRIAQEG
ncbi:MAG: cation:proton antiporter domain-containing protein [Thermoplasmata archaeon]